MQLGLYFIHPRVYENSRYMGFVLAVFPLKCGYIIVQSGKMCTQLQYWIFDSKKWGNAKS